MIDIEDDVPLPDDGWTSKPFVSVAETRKVYERECRYIPPPQPGPSDCTFIGGPLNGKFGPIKGNDKVVEIEIYKEDGSVRSVELYALNDTHPTPTFRVHVGSKQP